MTISVVLAEDNALLRHGLVRLIGADADLALVGSAPDLPTLLQLVEKHDPDVVVTDIRMPRRTPTRASPWPRSCARAVPAPGCCCSASTPRPPTR